VRTCGEELENANNEGVEKRRGAYIGQQASLHPELTFFTSTPRDFAQWKRTSGAGFEGVPLSVPWTCPRRGRREGGTAGELRSLSAVLVGFVVATPKGREGYLERMLGEGGGGCEVRIEGKSVATS